MQVYFQSPYTDYDKANGIEKAAAELCGFAKTDVLAPGASEDVTITVKKSELRTYDANNAKTYILDAGDYYFTAATDSHNAVNNILAAKGYTLTGAKMKEIQAVNACRRDAVAKGVKLEEAMDKWQTMDQLPAEYRS